MESYDLKISGRDHGSLLQNKTFVPLDGPLLSISNSSCYMTIRFVRAAWDKLGTRFVASDYVGNVYMFNLQKNRFQLVCRLNTCSSFLVFSNDKTQDILVALADCTIVSLNSEARVVQNSFHHHSSCVTCISFDKSGSKVLSCSKDQAILWELTNFNVLRVLTLKKNVDIVKVFFIPNKDIIVSAFKDSSVFLWNFNTFICMNEFLCSYMNTLLNTKTLDASSDGKLLACAGKADWFLIWSVEEDKILYTVSLPQNSSSKQISFLPSLPDSPDSYILSLLNADGEIRIYNLKSMEYLCKVASVNKKIISFANSSKYFQILAISLQGNLVLYDVEDFVRDVHEEKIPVSKSEETHHVPRVASKVASSKMKMTKKKKVPDIDKKRLMSVVKNFGEFPERYRFFIWSHLLELPHNEDAFNVLHQESLKITSFAKDYSFMNPGIQKTFLRIMAMLACWMPVLEEIEYFQCVVFPFVKILHKNIIKCFEILVTLIGNWCQNWFLFCPFPPFNILCVVENIICFHDQELMLHFAKQDISAEVYAWPLLQTSFSEVFNKKQWLKLWDNIFSNPISFFVYAVAAFNIIMREVLLRCQTLEQFKKCFNKHGISASALIRKTYDLQKTSPPEIDPEPVVGSFASVPKGAYSSFIEMSQMKIDLQTHTRKSLIDQEIYYICKKEDILEIKSNYLMELQKLQILRRKMLLENMELKDADALEALNKKLKKVQVLIQDNLKDQISMLKEKVGEGIFSGKMDKSHYFKFKAFVNGLKGKAT